MWCALAACLLALDANRIHTGQGLGSCLLMGDKEPHSHETRAMMHTRALNHGCILNHDEITTKQTQLCRITTVFARNNLQGYNRQTTARTSNSACALRLWKQAPLRLRTARYAYTLCGEWFLVVYSLCPLWCAFRCGVACLQLTSVKTRAPVRLFSRVIS
jgi:hypothetical protein